jgi:RAB protein geranylgeranyltransferase component A
MSFNEEESWIDENTFDVIIIGTSLTHSILAR